MQAALYFPFISVPLSSWWTRTILYWDSVGTIVPASHRNDPDLVDPRTRDLIREGLVRQFLPEDAGGELQQSFEGYLHRLRSKEVDQRRIRFQQTDVALVHEDKWLSYRSGLQQVMRMGLAKQVRRGWVAIESSTAAEFMAALALALCHEAARDYEGSRLPESWVPVTDQPQACAVLLSGLEPAPQQRTARRLALRVRGEVAATEIRTDLLEDLLPVPDEALAIDQIIAFRSKYGDLLPALRRAVEAKVDEALMIDDETLRFRLLDRIYEEFEERVVQAESYLRETGLERISRSRLLRIFKFIPGLKDPLDAGQELAESLRTHPDLKSEPLAYLAFARAILAPARVYRPDPAVGASLV